MKHISILVLLFMAQSLLAQPKAISFPKTALSIQEFIPTDFFIIDSVQDDFNQDGLNDIVLVLALKTELSQDFSNETNRTLLILQKNLNGYQLSSYTTNGILCKNCGGIFGDPFDYISLKKNILDIHHYGGSAWRWTSHFTFRFQQNRWELIGISQDSFWINSDCDGQGIGDAGRNLTEVNFSTSKMNVTRTKGTECKPFKNTTIRFAKKPLIQLSQFNVDQTYWPIQVKD